MERNGIQPAGPDAPPASDSRTDARTTWLLRLKALREFVKAHDRLPRRTIGGALTDRAEQQLFYWMRRQRKREHLLAPDQRAALETVAAFAWEPRLDSWKARCRDVEHFVASHARLPRRRAQTAEERSLGAWLDRQRPSTAGALSRTPTLTN